jgi:quinol monooxygenase YgiN
VTKAYVYLWEFIVKRDCMESFERTYGEEGEWVQLFRRAPGYLRSELHRDVAVPGRYVTVDYWTSESAWQSFRSRFADEFAALDAQCTKWTTAEKEIGRFEPVSDDDEAHSS